MRWLFGMVNVIWPKSGDEMSLVAEPPLGLAKFVRLNTLNTSHRNCALADSPSRKPLTSEASKFRSLGPITMLRPALPNRLVPEGRRTNAVVSQNRCTVCWPEGRFGLRIRSGRSEATPSRLGSEPSWMMNGLPL